MIGCLVECLLSNLHQVLALIQTKCDNLIMICMTALVIFKLLHFWGVLRSSQGKLMWV